MILQNLQSYKTISEKKRNKLKASLNYLRAETVSFDKRLTNLEENGTAEQNKKNTKIEYKGELDNIRITNLPKDKQS